MTLLRLGPSGSVVANVGKLSSCGWIGHHVTRHEAGDQRCRCGDRYLRSDQRTRVRHVLGCFLFGHHYRHVTTRGGLRECVCVACGHPLLLRDEVAPHEGVVLTKRVRYWCNLFGHRHVREVERRHDGVEYVCACGHTFLRPQAGLVKITHPLGCLFLGHTVRYLETRDGHREFTCVRCGHLFCFATP